MTHYPDDPPVRQSLWRRLRDRWSWRDDALSDVQRDVIAIRGALVDQNSWSRMIMKELKEMGAREDAARARQIELIDSIKSGWASLMAERDAWKKAAQDAEANADARVAEALAADSEHDADALEQANAAMEELIAIDEEDADSGDNSSDESGESDGGDSEGGESSEGDENDSEGDSSDEQKSE